MENTLANVEFGKAVMQKAQVNTSGFEGNPIRGRVKLVHKGA